MKQLIKIQNTPDGQKKVSAREMYVNLGLNLANWKRWANKNIERNPFAVEGIDWAAFVLMMNGNQTKDYIISLDFAKKLCMQARTDKGELIRNYFLEVEKVAIQGLAPQLPDNRKLLEIEAKIRRLEARTAPLDISEFTIFGYARYCNKSLYGSEPTTLGKRAAKVCRELGLPIGTIRDARFGKVNTYPETVLFDVFTEFFKQPRF